MCNCASCAASSAGPVRYQNFDILWSIWHKMDDIEDNLSGFFLFFCILRKFSPSPVFVQSDMQMNILIGQIMCFLCLQGTFIVYPCGSMFFHMGQQRKFHTNKLECHADKESSLQSNQSNSLNYQRSWILKHFFSPRGCLQRLQWGKIL